MRSLSEVASSIHEIAKEHDAEFAARVWSIKTSADYAAPEAMYLHWRRLGEAFQHSFPQEGPDACSDWQKKCVEILMAKAGEEGK